VRRPDRSVGNRQIEGFRSNRFRDCMAVGINIVPAQCDYFPAKRNSKNYRSNIIINVKLVNKLRTTRRGCSGPKKSVARYNIRGNYVSGDASG